MDSNTDNIERRELDILLTEDDNEGNGDNNASVNVNALLQQLLSATTNLSTTVNDVKNVMNEMKCHQRDMQVKIDLIDNVIFNTETHETRVNKPNFEHGVNVMNEASKQIGDITNSTLDDDEIDKTVNTLRVSFGTVNFNNGNNSDSLSNIDLDLHRNVSTELSFDGYRVVLNDKSLHFVTSPKYLSWQLTHISVHAIYVLMQKLEDFVSNAPEAALKTSSLFSSSVKRSLEAYSCIHTPTLNSKSWLSINLDEAILRARLVAAPTNKGAIIQELQQFKRPFDDRLSLAPDRLPNIWASMMTWVKEFERYYYLCTFYDYSKSVYGLAPNQQPESAGQFGVITVMYSLTPSVLSTYIKRNFFDVDRGPGDTKYRIFASPFLYKAKKSFIYSFFKWIQAEYIAALKIANKIKETSDNKLIVTKSGVPVKGVHSMKFMIDNPEIDYNGQLMYVHNSALTMIAEHKNTKSFSTS